MRAQRNAVIIATFFALVSLLTAIILEYHYSVESFEHKALYISLSISILASALLLIFVSLINYFSIRKELVNSLYLKGACYSSHYKVLLSSLVNVEFEKFDIGIKSQLTQQIVDLLIEKHNYELDRNKYHSFFMRSNTAIAFHDISELFDILHAEITPLRQALSLSASKAISEEKNQSIQIAENIQENTKVIFNKFDEHQRTIAKKNGIHTISPTT